VLLSVRFPLQDGESQMYNKTFNALIQSVM